MLMRRSMNTKKIHYSCIGFFNILMYIYIYIYIYTSGVSVNIDNNPRAPRGLVVSVPD